MATRRGAGRGPDAPARPSRRASPPPPVGLRTATAPSWKGRAAARRSGVDVVRRTSTARRRRDAQRARLYFGLSGTGKRLRDPSPELIGDDEHGGATTASSTSRAAATPGPLGRAATTASADHLDPVTRAIDWHDSIAAKSGPGTSRRLETAGTRDVHPRLRRLRRAAASAVTRMAAAPGHACGAAGAASRATSGLLRGPAGHADAVCSRASASQPAGRRRRQLASLTDRQRMSTPSPVGALERRRRRGSLRRRTGERGAGGAARHGRAEAATRARAPRRDVAAGSPLADREASPQLARASGPRLSRGASQGRCAGSEPVAGATGLEPATSGVTGRRSNQLSYAPAKGR